MKKIYLLIIIGIIIPAAIIGYSILTYKSPAEKAKESAMEKGCEIICENIITKPSDCENINYEYPDIKHYCNTCKQYPCSIPSEEGDSCPLSC